MSGKQKPSHRHTMQLALRHLQLGRIEESEALLKGILQTSPHHPQALHTLGILFHQKGDYETATDLINRSIAAAPQVANFHYNLGLVLVDQGDLPGAIEAFRKALSVDPEHAEAASNTGTAFHKMGRVDESIRYYREALRLKPDYTQAHSNLLFTLAYHALLSPQEMLKAHMEWDRIHGEEGRAHAFLHDPDQDPERRLKIGYVSPDFRRHAVSKFFVPLISAHDHDLFEVYCYAEVQQADEVTERIKKHADHWRSTVGLSDKAVAARIHQDGIDILIDLAGHTDRNRLKAFTYKPAPIQAAYLGYCATTGLSAMDYWITDSVLHPPETEEKTVETVYRLPRCWLCYGPEEDAPPADKEADVSQSITFGSFNHVSKITPKVSAAWARILQLVPDSKLVLKANQLQLPEIAQAVRKRFEALGIIGDRLELHPPSPDYLSLYNLIDIALDPFPRTGGATTADALWMGVPVITLAGRRFIERQGASLLTAVGLPDLIAADTDEYVSKAVTLAEDNDRRRATRATLRRTVPASPLCDGPGLARALEAALRDMWRHYSNSTDGTG